MDARISWAAARMATASAVQPLPTDAGIVAIPAPDSLETHQVHEALIAAQSFGNLFEFRIAIADDHGLRVLQNGSDTWRHQTGDMGDVLKDKLAIGSHEAGD